MRETPLQLLKRILFAHVYRCTITASRFPSRVPTLSRTIVSFRSSEHLDEIGNLNRAFSNVPTSHIASHPEALMIIDEFLTSAIGSAIENSNRQRQSVTAAASQDPSSLGKPRTWCQLPRAVDLVSSPQLLERHHAFALIEQVLLYHDSGGSGGFFSRNWLGASSQSLEECFVTSASAHLSIELCEI